MEAVRTFGLPEEYVQDLPVLWMETVHPDDRENVTAAYDHFRGSCTLFGSWNERGRTVYQAGTERLCRGN